MMTPKEHQNAIVAGLTAEPYWADVPEMRDVLAENEMARFDAYVDAMSDAYEDGDDL